MNNEHWINMVIDLIMSIGLTYVIKMYFSLKETLDASLLKINELNEKAEKSIEKTIELNKNLEYYSENTNTYFYVLKTLLDIKTKRLFIKDYSGLKFLKISGETNSDYLSGHPEYGLYYNDLMEEFKQVKDEIQLVLKDKKVSDIDEIMKLYYPKITDENGNLINLNFS